MKISYRIGVMPGPWPESATMPGALWDLIDLCERTEIDSLWPQDWHSSFPRALSIDGETAYLATFFGYEKVRVSDGFILEQVSLGNQPYQMLMLPSGNTLIVITGLPGSNKGEWCLMVIDLR